MSLRNLLVVASLALSVAIGAVLARRGGSADGGTRVADLPRIGLSLDTLKEARWQGDRDRFVARAAELGAEVIVQSANSDDARQMADVESLITRGVDVLVIVPHDGDAMAEAVRKAHAAGIPVIAYDRLIRGCDLDLYVTFDNVHVGRLQARYLLQRLEPSVDRPARIVRIYGAKTDNNARLFKAGQDEVLKPMIESGAIEVVHSDWAGDWKPEEARRIASAAITSTGGDFAAILATNDGTAGGAIQALREEGIEGRVVVTGQDADLVACQRIAAGTQSMTVYKPLKTLATGAAELAVRMATGRPVVARDTVDNEKIDVPSMLYEVQMVTDANLVQTVIADGFHDYDQVYRHVDEDKRPPRPSPEARP